jgi:uncharacterized protein (DUF1778 family)
MEKQGLSSTKAKNKYNKENYDRLYISVKKGEKDIYTDIAKIAGYHSLNEFVISAIQDKIRVINEDNY